MDPTRTLHFAVAQEIVALTGERTRTMLDVNANWTPFPGGALQFIIAHNELLRAIEFGQDKNSVIGVRWNLPRGSYFDLSYQKTISDYIFQTTDSRVLSLMIRLYV
jgi:hypothetical protein